MKRALTVLLLVAIFFGGGYWFYAALAGCNVPIAYSIGTVDPRFELDTEEVRNAISSAESLWEDGTDRNLFTYEKDGELVINFVYDERQAETKEEERFREALDQKEGMSDEVRASYQKLVTEYERLKQTYESDARAYETKLTAYNKEVASWNARGGAPKDVFERLETTEVALEKEESRLNTRSNELNVLVRKLNTLGAQGNVLVDDYNSLVSEYNNKFGDEKEFTQGDYQEGIINIYEFGNEEELVTVLAHEMGHALGIEHIDEPSAVMYHHMEKQEIASGLTIADRDAFIAKCGGSERTMAETLRMLRETLLKMLADLR